MRTEIQDEITSFIADEVLDVNGTGELPEDVPLLSGLLDSFGLMSLIGFLEERYGLTIGNDQIVKTNFESVAVLAKFVESKLQEVPQDDRVAEPLSMDGS